MFGEQVDTSRGGRLRQRDEGGSTGGGQPPWFSRPGIVSMAEEERDRVEGEEDPDGEGVFGCGASCEEWHVHEGKAGCRPEGRGAAGGGEGGGCSVYCGGQARWGRGSGEVGGGELGG